MATQLSVVNDCLAIMGEAPLNVLTEDHSFKQSALNTLERVDKGVQAKDWWYNMERHTLKRNIADGRVYFPTDMGTMVAGSCLNKYVQRGRVLYDLEAGSNVFPEGFELKVILKRRIPIEDVPTSVADYIARRTVLEFQQEYDGDQTKTRNLKEEVYGVPGVTLGLKGEASAEHIRNRKINLIANNERLSRITNTVNYSRRPR